MIAKLKLLESGLVREAQNIDEFYVKINTNKKKDADDMDDEEMGNEVFSNAEDYEAHLGKTKKIYREWGRVIWRMTLTFCLFV